MSRDDGFPSYRVQLREVLRAKIEEGEYPPGTAIPSENELSAAYGLNRRTVREAVALLVREGLLRSVAGKGVYVRLKGETRLGEGEFGFRLREPHRLRRQVLKKALRAAGPYYGRMLAVPADGPLFHVRQRVLEGDQPLYVEEFYLPREVFPGIEGIEFMAFSVLEVFRYYGRTSSRTEQSLEIVPVDPGNGKLLGLSEGDPILLLERRDFDESGRPLAFFRYRTRGDVCDLRVSFRRAPK